MPKGGKNIFIQKKKDIVANLLENHLNVSLTFNFTMAIDKSWWGTGEKHSFDPFTRSVDAPVQSRPITHTSATSHSGVFLRPSSDFNLTTELIIVESLGRKTKKLT